MLAVEQAIVLAVEAYDAGQFEISAKAIKLAIKAAAGDRYWLNEIRKHLEWFKAGFPDSRQ